MGKTVREEVRTSLRRVIQFCCDDIRDVVAGGRALFEDEKK